MDTEYVYECYCINIWGCVCAVYRLRAHSVKEGEFVWNWKKWEIWVENVGGRRKHFNVSIIKGFIMGFYGYNISFNYKMHINKSARNTRQKTQWQRRHCVEKYVYVCVRWNSLMSSNRGVGFHCPHVVLTGFKWETQQQGADLCGDLRLQECDSTWLTCHIQAALGPPCCPASGWGLVPRWKPICYCSANRILSL